MRERSRAAHEQRSQQTQERERASSGCDEDHRNSPVIRERHGKGGERGGANRTRGEVAGATIWSR